MHAESTDSCTVSWYGEECRGRLTASGVPFDPAAFTCASYKYPLGTRLLVSHKNCTVLVTVNDRGPAKRLHRTLDLSRAAFQKLAPLKKGVITVTIQSQ